MPALQPLTAQEELAEENRFLIQSFVDANWGLAWTSLPSIAVMAWLLAPTHATVAMWSWLALMYVQSAHMLLVTATFRRHLVNATNARWRRRYLFETMVFAGLCWGSSALFLWPEITLEQHVVLLLYMAGVCSIAGVCNASLLAAGAAFQVSAWLPIFAQLISDPSAIASRVLLMIVLFVGIMIVAMMQGAALHRKTVHMTIVNRRLLVEVSDARQIAEAANEGKDRFLAAVSHDLRQPAYALSLMLRTVANHPLPETVAVLVDKACGSLANMRGMLDALLDLTRLQTGAVTLRREAVLVRDVFATIHSTMAGYADARGLLLSFRDSTFVMDTDRTAIARIIGNLVENAIRYTERGRILVTARRRGMHVLLQVWDTGPGIAAQDHERIFDTFVQLDNPQRDWRRGLGLGLSIVRNLADTLGHELSVNSRPGHGTAIGVVVPRLEYDYQVAQVPAVEFSDETGHVLVIEDDRDVREAVTLWLTGQGYTVSAAADVDEVLNLPSITNVRAAVIDYRLSGAHNGAQQLQLLRAALGRALPALVVTGDTQGSHIAELRAAGLQVLFKPLEPDALREALRRLLAHT